MLGAKYERILKPMANLVLVPADAANVTQRYMFMETLFHELAHSLGPGSIVVNGRKTTVDKELKEIASGFEEAKADVMGAWNVMYMMDQGVLPQAERNQIERPMSRACSARCASAWAKRTARARRCSTASAREGRAGVGPAGRPLPHRPGQDRRAIRDLVGAIVRLQGNGDYAGTKAFLDKYAVLDPEAQRVIASMDGIPVDIRPVYPDRV